MKQARQQLRQRFRSSAIDRLRRLSLALIDGGDGTLDSAVVEEAARELHTIKGESQLLGMGELSTVIHQAEERLRGAAEKSALAALRGPLRLAFEQVVAALQRQPEDEAGYQAALLAAQASLAGERPLATTQTAEAEYSAERVLEVERVQEEEAVP